jgi:FkbM family methyltransferase
MSTIRYIEIGANHPIQTSSTYLLHRLYGATGVLVEPIPALAETLKKTRPADTVVNCTVTASHAPTVALHIHEKNELSSILAEHSSRFQHYGGTEKITETIVCQNLHVNDFMKTFGSGPVDFLSVDLEGLDIEVIHAMDPVFQPTIIQCEHEGAVERFSHILRTRGYGLLGLTDVNAIFVRSGII